MNILVVDRSMRVVDEIVKRYQINPRENKVRRVSRPEHLLGMDLTGWLVMTARWCGAKWTGKTQTKKGAIWPLLVML